MAGRGTCVVLTAAMGLCAGQATASAATAVRRPASPSLVRLVRAQGGTLADAQGARSASLRKLDSHLQDLAADRLSGATARSGSAAPAVRDSGRAALTLSDAGTRVAVDVRIAGDLAAAERALRAAGMEVVAASDRQPERMVEGTIAIAALQDVAALRQTQAVLAVEGSGTNTGSVLSQGDAAHRGPQARALGPTGAGVPVGIISDSIDRVGSGVAGSQSTGDLPATVQVLRDGSSGSEDEGRAMAEIVYDEAPGVTDMRFTTGQGAAIRASGIDALVADGTKVVADDTFQITEPFFQDGVVAQAVDRAKAAGVTYLVSAGNRARQSWEGTYAPTADPRAQSSSTEDFDPSSAIDPVQTIGTFTDASLFLELQWDEPFGQAQTDLAVDVYTIGSGGVPTYAFTADTDNLATGVPAEFVGISTSGTATLGIAIRRVAGTRNPFMKYVVGGTSPFTIAEHDTSSDAIDPDASSARGALTVGASEYDTPGTPEDFSSRGPAFKLFSPDGTRLSAPDVRPKPDLDAADGVATSVPGFGAFYGTSAAAPSAAGIAALVRSANPGLGVDEVAAILEDTSHTIDCTLTPGVPDPDCGFGFELADGAVRQALDPSPPTVTPTLTPATPDGADGWYTTPSVGLTWAAADDGSPVGRRSGCDPSSVTTDTAATFSCAATSAGGTTTQAVTIKRDASPPAAPTITGIAPQVYAAGALPAAGAVGCASADPTSGVAACAVAGYSAAVGAHALTATATDGAGLSSTSTLTYAVAAPPAVRPNGASPAAISALKVAKRRLAVAGVLRSGVLLTVKSAGAKTRLAITLTLRGHRVATLTRTVKAGTTSVRVRLSRKGRARLRKAGSGTLALKVVGSGSGLTTTTLTAKVPTKR